MLSFTKMALAALVAVSMFAVYGCNGEGTATTPGHEQMTHEMSGHAQDGETEIAQKTCPVMGLPINKDVYVDYQGRRIYFCCEGCPDEFMKDPEKYLAKLDGAEAPEQEQQAEQWTCAMHPQVSLAEPGKCPICGMDLIPKAEDKTSGADDQAQQWTCSMHPQIRQAEAGQCPICGMDLIPAESIQSEHSH